MTSLQKYVPNPILDPREGVILYDDFLSGTTTTGSLGIMGWSLGGTGGTIAFNSPNTAGTFGEIELSVNATTSDFSQVYLIDTPNAPNPNFSTLVFDIRFRCALSQTTNLAFFIGLTEFGQGEQVATDYIGIGYDTAKSDTQFSLVTKKSSGARNVVTIQAVDTNYHTFRIRGDGTGTIYASIDYGAEVSTATSVPTVAIAIEISLFNHANSAIAMLADYFWGFFKLSR